MDTKKYRCLTCGYVIDCYENETVDNTFLRKLFTFIKEEDGTACPGCLHNLRVLKGRKPGKIRVPLIEAPGQLVLETPEVKAELEALESDFQKMTQGDTAVADRYSTTRLFGFTGSELLTIKAQRDSRKR